MTCPCGEKTVHEIARRLTLDEKPVLLWSDGSVTARFGFSLPGLGAPRSEHARGKAIEAGRLALDEVCAHNLTEVVALVKAARRAVVQKMLPPVEFLRRTMAGERFRFAGRDGAVVASSPTPERLRVHLFHEGRDVFLAPSARRPR